MFSSTRSLAWLRTMVAMLSNKSVGGAPLGSLISSMASVMLGITSSNRYDVSRCPWMRMDPWRSVSRSSFARRSSSTTRFAFAHAASCVFLRTLVEATTTVLGSAVTAGVGGNGRPPSGAEKAASWASRNAPGAASSQTLGNPR